jgi:hypothetical protein
MAWTSDNMFKGGATLVEVDGQDVGATTGGVRLRRDIDWNDLEIDQTPLKVKTGVNLQGMGIEFDAAEPTLANIRRAWSIVAGSLVSSSLQLTEALGTAEVEVNIEGPTIEYGTLTKRVYNFQRGVCRGGGEIMIGRSEWAKVPYQIEVFVESYATGRFGAIWDIA